MLNNLVINVVGGDKKIFAQVYQVVDLNIEGSLETVVERPKSVKS